MEKFLNQIDKKEILKKLEKWEYFSYRGEFQYAQYVIQEIIADLRNNKKESEELLNIINKFYNPELHKKMVKNRYKTDLFDSKS